MVKQLIECGVQIFKKSIEMKFKEEGEERKKERDPAENVKLLGFQIIILVPTLTTCSYPHCDRTTFAVILIICLFFSVINDCHPCIIIVISSHWHCKHDH